MGLLEAVALRVGTASAIAVGRLWLKRNGIGARRPLGDLLKLHLDEKDERRTTRDLERAAEEIAERLSPLIASEFFSLSENERLAATSAVADGLERAAFERKALLEHDLDPAALEGQVRRAFRPVGLSEGASQLYGILLRETCNYIVEIVITLPAFAAYASREILQRETELLALVQQILDKLPAYDVTMGIDRDTDFDVRYRREIARRFDWLELFGLSVDEVHRRYALSVAYITLSSTSPAATDRKSSSASDRGDLLADSDGGYVRVDDALARQRRTVVRGEAGSGKTTLLHWLAVRCARSELTGSLSEWGEHVPFFLPLRRYVGKKLPPPEEWLEHSAPNSAGVLPPGWVHDQLEAGRALVLIDGVDELPEEEREGARRWVRELCEQFPEARYVVTSRPPAVEEDWLRGSGFGSTDLQPMTLPDIEAFLEHWHDAASAGVADAAIRADVESCRVALRQVVRENLSLRALATSPLLCAMLCALHRDRRKALPADRMELYRIALETLLERRDVERQVNADQIQYLQLPQKKILLQDIAYWLLLNNQVDAARADVLAKLEAKIESMPRIAESAEDVYKFLLLRSGLIREPTEGRVDFLHKTFQEYLGAAEAVEQQHIPLLIDRAHLDQWREVIILASGHAQKPQREQLIMALLKRGDADSTLKHRLHLLAVACMETAHEWSPSLYAEMNTRLKRLVPPRNMSEARALASAGDLAVALLTGHRHRNVPVVAAVIRTLSLIGTEQALNALAAYGRDTRVMVAREIIRAWSSFDIKEYASKVLAVSPLDRGGITMTSPEQLNAVGDLKHLSELRVNLPGSNASLEPLRGLMQLTRLDIRYSRKLSDLSPLEGLVNLEHLDLEECSSVERVSVLRGLQSLKFLDLSHTAVRSIEPVGGLTSLAWLGLQGLPIRSVRPLRSLARLRSLFLDGCHELSDLGALEALDELRTLSIREARKVRRWDTVGRLPNLQSLTISESNVIRTLEFLRPTTSLQSVWLTNLPNLHDISALDGRRLRMISFRNCPNVQDVAAIVHPAIRHLELVGTSPDLDLDPLRVIEGASIWIDVAHKLGRVPSSWRKRNRVYRAAGASPYTVLSAA
jgi:hypothetical protein